MAGWPIRGEETPVLGLRGILGTDYLTDLAPLTAIAVQGTYCVLCGDALGRLTSWDIFRGAVRFLGFEEGRPTSPVTAVACPREWCAVSAHPDGRLRQWNVDEGRSIREREIEPADAAILAVVPDGPVAHAGGTGPIALYRPDDLELVGRIPTDGSRVTAMCGWETGLLLVAHESRLRGCASSGEVVCEAETPSRIRSLFASRTGRIIVTGHDDGAIRVWKAPPRSAEPKARVPLGLVQAYEPATRPILAVGADARRGTLSFVTADGTAGDLRRRDGKLLDSWSLGLPANAAAVALEENEIYAATARGVPWIRACDYRGFVPTRLYPDGPFLECPCGTWVAGVGGAAAMLCDPGGRFRGPVPQRPGTTSHDLRWDPSAGRVLHLISEDAPLEDIFDETELQELHGDDEDARAKVGEVIDLIAGQDEADRLRYAERGSRLVLRGFSPDLPGDTDETRFDIRLDSDCAAGVLEPDGAGAWFVTDRRIHRADARTGEVALRVEAPRAILQIAVDPVAGWIAGVTEPEDGASFLRLWRLDGTPVSIDPEVPASCSTRPLFSPDGGTVLVRDPEDGGRLVLTATGASSPAPLGPWPVRGMAWSDEPDRVWVAGGGVLRRVRLPGGEIDRVWAYAPLDHYQYARWATLLLARDPSKLLLSEGGSGWIVDLAGLPPLPLPLPASSKSSGSRGYSPLPDDRGAGEPGPGDGRPGSGRESAPLQASPAPGALLAAAAIRVLEARFSSPDGKADPALESRLEALLRAARKAGNDALPAAAAEALAVAFALNPRLSRYSDRDPLSQASLGPLLGRALRDAAKPARLERWLQYRIAPAQAPAGEGRRRAARREPVPQATFPEDALERVQSLFRQNAWQPFWIDAGSCVAPRPEFVFGTPDKIREALRANPRTRAVSVNDATNEFVGELLEDANLQHLKLWIGPDFDLTPLRGRPLESLELYASRPSGTAAIDLRPLAGAALRRLTVGTMVRIPGISAIGEISNLEVLSLDGTVDADELRAHLPATLRGLALCCSTTPPQWKAIVKALPSLVYLKGHTPPDAALGALEACQELRALEFTQCKPARKLLLPPLPNLHTLVVPVGKGSGESLAETAARTPSLELLDLDSSSTDDASSVTRWERLRHLRLSNANGLKDISFLSDMPALEILSFRGTLTMRDLSQPGPCAKVRMLELFLCRHRHLEALDAWPALELISV